MLASQESPNDGRLVSAALAATTSELAGFWARLEATLAALTALEKATESRRHVAAMPSPVLVSADDNHRLAATPPSLMLAAQEAAKERHRHAVILPTLVVAVDKAANERRRHVTAVDPSVFVALASTNKNHRDGAATISASVLVGQALADERPSKPACRRN